MEDARRPGPSRGPGDGDRQLLIALDGDRAEKTARRIAVEIWGAKRVAAIHVAVLRGFKQGAPSRVLNCGSGRGASVREVLAAVRAEASVEFGTRDGVRRAGDLPVVVGDIARLRAALHWSPRHGGLRAIVRSALAWERAHGRVADA